MADLGWNRECALEQAENEQVLRELLDLLRASSSHDLELIREGIASGDWEAVGQAAHDIRGAAAGLAMEGLALLAHEIEQAGRANDRAFILSHFEELEMLIGQLEQI